MSVCCRCKKGCFKKLSEGDQMSIFNRFYQLNSKNEQDIFLQGLIEIYDVNRKRPRSEKARINQNSFKYNVLIDNMKQEVCLNAFLSLYAIPVKRVRRIRNLAVTGKSPCDNRGKCPSSNALDIQTLDLVRDHIQSFPVKESHYSCKQVKYLDAKLNIKIMFKLFQKKHPSVKISYVSFFKFFTENCNLSFGRPQVDSCCQCEELNIKIKSPHLSDYAKRTAVGELIVHKRRSKRFYNELKFDAHEGKKDETTLAIAFDYMQNVQLPQIPVQEIFYLRQLSVNVFCIHDIKNKNSYFYVYHEGQAKKGPNEVSSFLYDYLCNVPQNIKNVRLYSDNAAGQNKNHCISRMLLALTDSGRFESIRHYYPIRGHSYLPCDRDFGLIKRNLKRHDRVYTLHEITEIIIHSSSKKFTVKEITVNDIWDFKSWWPKYYKKTTMSKESCPKSVPRSDKVSFNIASFHFFEYSSKNKGSILTSQHIGGEQHTFQLLLPGNRTHDVPNVAYTGKVPLKTSKIEDIRKVIKYIDDRHKDFYDDILSWPTTADQPGADEEEQD